MIKTKYYDDKKVMSVQHTDDEGLTHREDGPAIIYYNLDGSVDYMLYWIHGKIHNEDSHAYISYNQNRTIFSMWYYINNKRVSIEEFKAYRRKNIIDRIINSVCQ